MAVVYAKRTCFVGRTRVKKGDAYDSKSNVVQAAPSVFANEPQEVKGNRNFVARKPPKKTEAPVTETPVEEEPDDEEEDSEVDEETTEDREESQPRIERATRAPGERRGPRPSKRPAKRQ